MTPSDRSLIRAQAISGLVFATFLVLHLLNTMLAAAGQTSYDAYQAAVRRYYQFPAVELPVIVIAVVVHVWAGALRARRRRLARRAGDPAANVPPSLRERLHRASGWLIALIFVGHVFATRGPGLLLDTPADFSFLTFSLTHWPWFFYPYYVVFVLAGLYHLGNGARVALRALGTRPALPEKLYWGGLALAALAALFGVIAFGGAFFSIDTTRFGAFRSVYERFYPAFLLPWLK